MRLRILPKAALCAAFVIAAATDTLAQAVPIKPSAKAVQTSQKVSLPKVTRVNINGLKKLLKPNGKPVLINFWATWCDPCREEFPDLVRLHAAYREKVDFVTVSLDELSEIKTDVPRFLAQVKSEMPAFLLKTPDDDAAIKAVSSEWAGSLPFTILYSADGGTAYLIKGPFKYADLAAELDKVTEPVQSEVKTSSTSK